MLPSAMGMLQTVGRNAFQCSGIVNDWWMKYIEKQIEQVKNGIGSLDICCVIYFV
jgi:hypothetical protein